MLSYGLEFVLSQIILESPDIGCKACTLIVQIVIKLELMGIRELQSFKQYSPFLCLPGIFLKSAELDILLLGAR
jgi:hypothetical protein